MSSSDATVPTLRTLYPEIEPWDQGRLKVSDIHELYYEQVGQRDAASPTAVVVHGGPGGGISGFYRQFFDPSVYRVVLFDQRGAGQSTPHACLTGPSSREPDWQHQ